MPLNTNIRAGTQIATAYNCRADGSCRQLLKQADNDGEVTLLMNKYFLPGTFVDMESGEVLSGPGEAEHWTQAFTARERLSVLAHKLKLNAKRLLGGAA